MLLTQIRDSPMYASRPAAPLTDAATLTMLNIQPWNMQDTRRAAHSQQF